MSIEIHCPACNKLIRAPDNAGGRRGKCPYCAASVYIPMPEDQAEEIPLAPVDETAEQRRERLRRESIAYAADVDHERRAKYDTAAGKADAKKQMPARGAADLDAEEVDVPDQVRAFVIAMRDSKLDEAGAIARRLKLRASQSREYVQGLMLDQMGLPIEGAPPALVNGFLKSLLERL